MLLTGLEKGPGKPDPYVDQITERQWDEHRHWDLCLKSRHSERRQATADRPGEEQP